MAADSMISPALRELDDNSRVPADARVAADDWSICRKHDLMRKALADMEYGGGRGTGILHSKPASTGRADASTVPQARALARRQGLAATMLGDESTDDAIQRENSLRFREKKAAFLRASRFDFAISMAARKTSLSGDIGANWTHILNMLVDLKLEVEALQLGPDNRAFDQLDIVKAGLDELNSELASPARTGNAAAWLSGVVRMVARICLSSKLCMPRGTP